MPNGFEQMDKKLADKFAKSVFGDAHSNVSKQMDKIVSNTLDFEDTLNSIADAHQHHEQAMAQMERINIKELKKEGERVEREKITASSTAKTAQHVESLDSRVDLLDSRLETESEERKAADEATLSAAKANNNGTRIRSWAAISISVAALLASVLANLDKIIANIELLSQRLSG